MESERWPKKIETDLPLPARYLITPGDSGTPRDGIEAILALETRIEHQYRVRTGKGRSLARRGSSVTRCALLRRKQNHSRQSLPTRTSEENRTRLAFSALSPCLHWQQPQSRTDGIYDKQRAFFQLHCHLAQSGADLFADHRGPEVFGADLNDTWLCEVGCSQGRTIRQRPDEGQLCTFPLILSVKLHEELRDTD